MPLTRSWVASANDPASDFPLDNLPCGVFSVEAGTKRCGVAIGDMIFDVTTLEMNGLLSLDGGPYFSGGTWNALMAAGPDTWAILRSRLYDQLVEGCPDDASLHEYLVAQANASMHLPFTVAEYTDFYAGRQHATNVGTMFRGAENALPPNWLSIPIGYNGRASSVVISDTPIRRPWGQIKRPDDDCPQFAPSKKFDMELEMGAIVGTPSHGPVTVAEADAMIFGYVLLNDWSARDIQAWESQPLGPFQAKATATTISPWIVMKAALEPFRTSTPDRERELLPYLREPGPMLYDIDLAVEMAAKSGLPVTITRTNMSELYYSAAQQLAHHSTSGCPMRTGDLLGSGTISGPERHERGSLLELSWGGRDPITIGDHNRHFIEDGDTLTLRGAAQGNGVRIGFGACSGTLLPALEDPFVK